jgi:hypothetical protein
VVEGRGSRVEGRASSDDVKYVLLCHKPCENTIWILNLNDARAEMQPQTLVRVKGQGCSTR